MNQTLPENTISVGGRGVVPVPPELIRISLYATGEGMLTEDAQRVAERKAGELKEAVQKAFPSLDAVSLSRLRIGEKTSRMVRPDAGEAARPEIVYQLTIIAGIEVEPDVPRIIDAALRAGAAFQPFARGCGPNGGSAISYGIKDHRPAEQEATAKALEDAREKALALAKLAGKTLGEIVTVAEHSQHFQSWGRVPWMNRMPERYWSDTRENIEVTNGVWVTFAIQSSPA